MSDFSSPPCNTHDEIMHRLMARHDVIIDLMGNKNVEYLDIPIHGNIGDILIFLGTMSFLRRNGIHISRCAAHFNYSQSDSKATILLHGGGNLGDLYPNHQLFRESVISGNPHRRIIILPQTIHFESREAHTRAERIMQAHPDLHIFVRDARSQGIAADLGRNVYLAPDMAHQLYPILPTTRATGGNVLVLDRTDKESRPDKEFDIKENTSFKSRVSTDWPQLVGRGRANHVRRVAHLVRILKFSHDGGLISDMFAKWWERYARNLTGDAIRLFSEHEVIVTDRLHAHILACLMDKRSYVHDNQYGKNSAYVNAWTRDSPLVRCVFDK